MSIKAYETNKGTRYRFTAYLGKDILTGKDKSICRGGFKTKKEAQSAMAELRFKADTGQLNFNTTRFDFVYRQWLPLYKTTVKDSTLNKTITIFDIHILPFFADQDLKNITPLMCQNFVNELSEKLVSYKSAYNYALRIYDYALKIGLVVGTNPFTRIIYPKVNKTKNKTKFLEIKELETLLSCMQHNKKWYAYFRLLAYTGMRRGEGLALNWKDIDFKNKTITISKTVTVGTAGQYISSSPKTTSGNRTIAVDDETLSIIQDYRSSLKTLSMLVFPGENSESIRLSKPGHFLNRVINKNNLKKITVHSLRHTHCSMLFEAGWSIKEVQERLGWSDTKTCLDVYYHVTENRKQKSMDSFIRYLKSN